MKFQTAVLEKSSLLFSLSGFIMYNPSLFMDIAVIIIILLSVYTGYKKGMVQSLFNLLSIWAALALARLAYPNVSRFLRDYTRVFDFINDTITARLGLSHIMREQTLKAQTDLIGSLPLPDYLSETLLLNNNNELYSILNVSLVEEYISGYLANICVNIIAGLLAFTLIALILYILSKSLGVVNKLPVIGHFNRFGGILAGLMKGVVTIWIILTILTIFYLSPSGNILWKGLAESRLAVYFYRNNLLLDFLTKIIV